MECQPQFECTELRLLLCNNALAICALKAETPTKSTSSKAYAAERPMSERTFQHKQAVPYLSGGWMKRRVVKKVEIYRHSCVNSMYMYCCLRRYAPVDPPGGMADPGQRPRYLAEPPGD